MRIALFTPLTPVRSGLAEHIEGLLPTMASHLDITIVTDGGYTPSHPLFGRKSVCPVAVIGYPIFRERAAEFDLVVYQLGNEATIHGYMLDAMPHYPGLVFLHDLFLHHAVLGWALNHSRPDLYVSEMRYNYGDEGERLARQVLAGQGEGILTTYPLIDRVLDNSLALIASNRYMCEQIAGRRPDLPVHHVPLHEKPTPDLGEAFDPGEFRKTLGLRDVPIVATFGLYSPHNRLSIALRAFRLLLQRHPQAVYLLIGSPGNRQELLDQVGHLGLSDSVRLTGWVSEADFLRYLRIADVAVQLRHPHAGGTSYPPILLLGQGVPTIISDIEPMADIPADAILRITPDDPNEEKQLFAALDYLLAHPAAAQAISSRGKQYVGEHHNLGRIAMQFVDLIQETAANREELGQLMATRRSGHSEAPRSSNGLVRVAGEALAQLGIPHTNPDLLRPIAAAVQSLLPSARDDAR